MKVYRNMTGQKTTIVLSANRRVLINAVDTRLSEEAYNEVKKIHPNLLKEVYMNPKKEKKVITEPVKKKEEKVVLQEPILKDEEVITEPVEKKEEDEEVIIEPVEKKEEKVVLKEKKRGRKKGQKNKK